MRVSTFSRCGRWAAPLVSLALAVTLTPTASAGAPASEHWHDRHCHHGARVLSDWEITAATGKSIEEWGAAWWQWAFSNPDVLGDSTGEFGPLGNVGGPVFFAEGSGGGPVELSYHVPGGQYILVPVATFIWTFFDPCADVHCAAKIINKNFLPGTTDVTASIDGQRVSHMKSHAVRVDRTPTVFTVDAGPIDEDGYGGILPALEGGYWLMLEPLSPGKHHLVFGATVPDLDPVTGEPTGGTLRLDATLDLVVDPPCHPKKHCAGT